MTRARSATVPRDSVPLRAKRDGVGDSRRAELQRQRQRIGRVLAEFGRELLRQPAVTGLAVELKVRGGELLRPLQYALQISVQHKEPRGRRRFAGLVPRRFHGVPTDVVTTRYARCLQAAGEPVRFHARPAGGCAIAPESEPSHWGTLGLVVQAGGRPMYLTNRHVAGPRGEVIVQPPLPPEILPADRWRIGVVVRCGATDNHAVDCALIEPAGAGPGRSPGAALLASLPGAAAATLCEDVLTDDDAGQARVWCWGAATGGGPTRWGTVRQTLAAVKFPDGSYLVRQIKVEAGSAGTLVQAGDSGAVLFREVGTPERPRWAAVGLVVGEYTEDVGDGVSRRGLVANHFAAVRRALRFARCGEDPA